MSLVIVIGGARGTGKSALARMLSNTLRADVLHLGRVRSLLRAVPGHDPVLDISVNRADTIAESMSALEKQAYVIKPAVERAISECEERQASLIIEGTHCLPGLYPSADVRVLLQVANATLQGRYGKDKARGGQNSGFQAANSKPITRNIQIQGCLLEAAGRRPKDVEVIDADYLPSAFIEIIRLIPERSIPRVGTDN